MSASLEAPNSDNRHQTVISVNEDDDNFLLDADLYYSAKAKQGGKEEFVSSLSVVSKSKNVHINHLLKTVTLAGDTVLHVAASNGNEDVVGLIITRFPSLLNVENLIGDTAVHVAVKAGEVSVLRVINSKRKKFLNPGSLIFCELADTEVAWTDSLKVQNKKGNTPLHEALIKGHQKMAVELVKEDVSVSIVQNDEDKSAFYLAAEAGYEDCLLVMMEYVKHAGIDLGGVGKSPIHAAILGKRIVILQSMLDQQPRLINLRDDNERTPLHFAALKGYEYVVRYLITLNNRNFIEKDKDKQLPIHLASMNGHIDVIKPMLEHHYNPHELLNGKGQNILHVAAGYGKYEVVKYILKIKDRQELSQLINKQDDDGNTPLHLATMKSHPKIVSALIRDKRVDLELTNNDNLTALAIAYNHMDKTHTFDQWLTWLSLKSSGARLSNARMQSKPTNTDNNTDKVNTAKPTNTDNNTDKNSKDRVNTLLLVSTLIVTVTFQACFQLPGGNNDSEPNKGFATMIKKALFQVFILCDTTALFTSLVVAAALIFTQVDVTITQTVLKLASPLLEFALISMSVAFMSGVIVTVNNLKWLSHTIWITVTFFLSVIVLLLIPISLPVTPRHSIFKHIITFFIFMVSSDPDGIY